MGNKFLYVMGQPVEKAIITTVWDAESGEPIALVVNSEDLDGSKDLNSKAF